MKFNEDQQQGLKKFENSEERNLKFLTLNKKKTKKIFLIKYKTKEEEQKNQ